MYKPTVTQKELILPSEINKKVFFLINGTEYQTVVTVDHEFFFWKVHEDRASKKMKKSKTQTVKEKAEHMLKTPLNLIKDFIKLNPFSQDKNKSRRINKMFSNKQGTCLVAVCSTGLVIVLPEFQLVQDLNSGQQVEVETAIEFVSFSQDNNRRFHFLRGTQKGGIYLHEVKVE